ncbi:hypothetical protein Tco_0597808 [Tanacetum coccineum]
MPYPSRDNAIRAYTSETKLTKDEGQSNTPVSRRLNYAAFTIIVIKYSGRISIRDLTQRISNTPELPKTKTLSVCEPPQDEKVTEAESVTKPEGRNQPVVRQPYAYKSERSQFAKHRSASQVDGSNNLTKPATPHSWPQVRISYFVKPYDVNAPDPSRKSPMHVSFQSPREFVGSNDMSARLLNTANGNKPKPRYFNQQPRNWPPSMSSRVLNRIVNIAEPPRNQKPFLKSKDMACTTCKKCIYNANHDECILKYLSKVNSRASAQKKDAQSYKTTKRYVPVEKKSDSKHHGRQIPIGQRFSPNKSSTLYLKTTPPIFVLTWKPTGRIFT